MQAVALICPLKTPLIPVDVNGTNSGNLVDNGAPISVVCTDENVSTPTHLTHVDDCWLLCLPLLAGSDVQRVIHEVALQHSLYSQFPFFFFFDISRF